MASSSSYSFTVVLILSITLLGFPSFSSSAIVERCFHVKNLTVNKLCRNQVITAVNGLFPGPALHVHEGDALAVTVVNMSPYNISIHWHGIFQKLSGWADGPAYVTQCPIRPGKNYTYRFTIQGQEGTLWWHAHVEWLRATVYGALIIKPASGRYYPFPEPEAEFPILLGEWWSSNVVDVETSALATGGAPNTSNGYTINGHLGHLYNCSSHDMFTLIVQPGKNYLLRIINSALNTQFFFKIAHHIFTVVAADASYTNPYVTDVVVLAPGQTVDALLFTNNSIGRYYMAATPYASAVGVPFDNSTTTGLLVYDYEGSTQSSALPIMPPLPPNGDTATANKFYTNMTGLLTGPFWSPVPLVVDEHMFIAVGIGLTACGLPGNRTCNGIFGQRLAATMNGASFQLPNTVSILQAFFRNVTGVYTDDFPDVPPVIFDFTNSSNSFNETLLLTTKSTKVKKVRYNSTIQIVIQDTALVGTENHPIHIHGFNFYVLAQGFGNYDPLIDVDTFNFFDPQVRNTIAVPVGGWAVIRFTANNPGVWFIHCHLDVHLGWGLASGFAVENGHTPESTLPPPPPDFPQCH